MTARHILSRWERVQAASLNKTVFSPILWIAALYVAEQGNVTTLSLASLMNGSMESANYYLKRLHALDLVTRTGLVQRTPSTGSGRMPVRYEATPGLYTLLGLATPTQEEGAA